MRKCHAHLPVLGMVLRVWMLGLESGVILPNLGRVSEGHKDLVVQDLRFRFR